VNEFLTARHHN